MTVTYDSFRQLGQMTFIEVSSDLGGTPSFFWYLDGVFYARTDIGELVVYLSDDDQVDIVAVDTLDPDNFDVRANAPVVFPARRELWWARSVALDVARYVVEQQREAEGFLEVGRVPATDAWSYRFVSPRLDDLTNYGWRIVPEDNAGNQGVALVLGPELVVRKPDAPAFSVAFDGGTTRVTFSAA